MKSAFLRLTCNLILGAATIAIAVAHAEQPAAKVNLKKIDKYYADPSTANIAGVWIGAHDRRYKPLMASDTQITAGTKLGTPNDNGLQPGEIPLDVWMVDGKPLPGRTPGGPWFGIPYTPKWQKAYEQRVIDNRSGKVHGDPHFDCAPRGAMASYHGGPNDMTITQTPGRIQQIFIKEQVGLRNIYTDGRSHPTWSDPNSDDYDPTPYGHSIGHWEGATLVVDTVGVDRAYTLGNMGMHSEMFHMVERITRTNTTTMDIDIVVDDKKALLKPMTMKIRYELAADQSFKEETCTNNRNVTDENGNVQTLLRPKKGADADLPED